MSNKKPSELAAWNNDKTMVMHAHKPGVSQKISIQEIIDAVPVPEMPEPLEVSEKGKELVALETVAEMKALLEVPEASEVGKDLMAIETVAEMKELLEVPDALEGEPALLQNDGLDDDTNKALRVGGFGWGVIGPYNTISTPFDIDRARSYNATGLYRFKGPMLGTLPDINLASTTESVLLNLNGANYSAVFQFLATDANNGKNSVYLRKSLGSFNWTEWKDILAIPAPLHDEVGSLRIAKVDPARLSSATTNSLGFIENIQGSYLVPHNFNGEAQTQTRRMSGRWTQVTYCVHDSEDILATLALWRRIA